MITCSQFHDVELDRMACEQETRKFLPQVRRGPAVALKEWHERWFFRRELSRVLSVAPHMIADIGLTLDEASEELARPFWRA